MSKIVLLDIDYTLFDTDSFKQSNLLTFRLYEEVLEVLTQLEKVATLGIFSEGVKDMQRLKLEKTQILAHFIEKHIHIMAHKEEELVKILHIYNNDEVFLVDDKLSVLAHAKKFFPSLKTIWVKRGKYAQVQEPILGFEPDAWVNDLSKVVEIVKQSNEV